MKTFSAKVTFSIDEDCCDTACPELSKSNILCKDDHNMDGSDKGNDFETTLQSESECETQSLPEYMVTVITT